jgi:hypothetical protein
MPKSIYAVLVLLLLSGAVSAQSNDQVFRELEQKGEIKFDKALNGWVPTNTSSQSPFVIASKEIKVSEKFFSLGRDVILAADYIEFYQTYDGEINTRNRSHVAFASARICLPGEVGENGADGLTGSSASASGSVTVYARTIESIRLNTSGDSGGKGGNGCPGGPGADTFIPSEDGGHITCDQRKKTAQDGKDGVRPSSDSISSGAGGLGGIGGRGGDAGGALIFAHQSRTTSYGVFDGGEPGKTGERGSIGLLGNPGPSGQGGESEDCTRTKHCFRDDPDCEQEHVYARANRGKAGDRGAALYGWQYDYRPTPTKGSKAQPNVSLVSQDKIDAILKGYGL